MKKLLLLAFLLFPTIASAQCNGKFSNGQVCGVATGGPKLPGPVPFLSFSGFFPLPQNQIFVGNVSNLAAAVAMSQDCTIVSSGAITCTKTNNVAFGTLATQSSVTGTQLPSPFTSGTASGNTSKFMTGSGSFPNGDVAAFDANGNIVDGGGAVGNVTSVPTPTNHQTGVWTGSTTIKGVGPGTTGQAWVSNGASADPSFQGGQWVTITTFTASGSAISDTTHITSTFTDYKLIFRNILPVTNSVNCQLLVHTGGAFPATSYTGNSLRYSGGAVGGVTSPTTFIPCDATNGATSNSGSGISGEIILYNASQTTSPKAWAGKLTHVEATNAVGADIDGFYTGANTAIDGFQVDFSSGHPASGTITLQGRL